MILKNIMKCIRSYNTRYTYKRHIYLQFPNQSKLVKYTINNITNSDETELRCIKKFACKYLKCSDNDIVISYNKITFLDKHMNIPMQNLGVSWEDKLHISILPILSELSELENNINPVHNINSIKSVDNIDKQQDTNISLDNNSKILFTTKSI